MAPRRLVAVLIVLLVFSTIAALLLPAPRQSGTTTRSTTSRSTTTTAPSPARPRPGKVVQAHIAAGAGAHPIELHVGDELRLRVIARRPDQVQLEGFGLIDAVAPDAPAQFDAFAERSGRFPVRLVEADRSVGEVVVKPRRATASHSGG